VILTWFTFEWLIAIKRSQHGSVILPSRESFLFRTDPQALDALRRWARDELRSVNGQLEYLLRKALSSAGRLPSPEAPAETDDLRSDTRETAKRPRPARRKRPDGNDT
jgi:hypothetical protein